MYKVVRRGKRKITTITNSRSESVFHEVDDLDRKQLEQAENNYEKVFVTIRGQLEQNEQYCCDDEQDRLSLAQVLVDSLRQSNLIRKDQK